MAVISSCTCFTLPASAASPSSTPMRCASSVLSNPGQDEFEGQSVDDPRGGRGCQEGLQRVREPHRPEVVLFLGVQIPHVKKHVGDVPPWQGPPPPREDGGPRDRADIAGEHQPTQYVKQRVVGQPADHVDLAVGRVHGIVKNHGADGLLGLAR